MKRFTSLCFLIVAIYSTTSHAQALDSGLTQFKQLYANELGQTSACQIQASSEYRVCSSALRNEGNAPFILHHNKVTEKVVVLFHGLSDSPFFFKSIAETIHKQGYNVIVALVPGHGLKDADADMEDSDLSERWKRHTANIMKIAPEFGERMAIGGFSTGGALALNYLLSANDPKLDALMLYSGAMQLDSSAERMLGIWGISVVAKLLDGDYQTNGPNLYKYPGVAKHSAIMLMNIINENRELMETSTLNTSIFSAHSEADRTTLFTGIESVMAQNKGANDLFAIPAELNVCHADVPVNAEQVEQMQFDRSQLEEINDCDVPLPNPMHQEMLERTVAFLESLNDA
jgi:alpha-beta hydrolase superfamily lysophospholipase